MSVRTVQRHLKELEAKGLIRRHARFRSEGRGRTSDAYILQGDNLAHSSDQGDKSRRTNTTNQDDQHDTIVVSVTGREPEENHKPKRASAMTEDWQPNPENLSRIKAKHPTIDHEREIENFRDHYISKAEKRADWDASLRTWMRNAEKWSKPKTGQTTGSAEFPAGSGGVFL